MISAAARVEQLPNGASMLVPREHGFWAILAVVVSSALSRVPRSAAGWLVAATVVFAAIALGNVLGRRVRRGAAFQVFAAAVLSLSGIPIQLAGGTVASIAAFDAVVWVALFTAAALAVRACFARASRRQSEHANRLTWSSIGVPAAAAVLLALMSMRAHALAMAVATVGVLAIAPFRPTAKHLKAVGIALATTAVVAAVVLRCT